MPKEHPSLSIRPTPKEVRDNLLKDLDREGYVVITHTGKILHSKETGKETGKEVVKENEKTECPNS